MTTYLIQYVTLGTPEYDQNDNIVGYNDCKTGYELMNQEEFKSYAPDYEIIASFRKVAEFSKTDLLGLHNQSETILNELYKTSHPVS